MDFEVQRHSSGWCVANDIGTILRLIIVYGSYNFVDIFIASFFVFFYRKCIIASIFRGQGEAVDSCLFVFFLRFFLCVSCVYPSDHFVLPETVLDRPLCASNTLLLFENENLITSFVCLCVCVRLYTKSALK